MSSSACSVDPIDHSEQTTDDTSSEPETQSSSSDGKTSAIDGKTSESDGMIAEPGGKTPESDGQTSESDGKTSSEYDGMTSDSDDNTSESDGKTSTGSSGSQPKIPAKESFMVWELACHPESNIIAVADRIGLHTRRLTLETGWDLSLEDSRRRALVLAQRENPRKVWVSLPCTAWSSMQNANRRTKLQRTRLILARHYSRQCLNVCLPICEHVVGQGGHFYFEWPARCQGWKVIELLRFKEVLARKGVVLYHCRIDGCAHGLKNRAGTHFLRKSWMIITNDQTMHHFLNKCCPKDHPHARIQGSETARSAYYPEAMAATVVLAWLHAGG